MSRKPTALLHARQFLAEKLKMAGLGSSERLPTIQQLASQAGVSHVTMLRAVRIFRRQGVLEVKHGKGIHILTGRSEYIPEKSIEDAFPSGKSAKWEQVVTAIRQDIFKGNFRSGLPLPRTKELAARYGVCLLTMQKALAHCVKKAILSRRCSRYIIPFGNVRGGQQVLVLIAAGDSSGTISMATARTRENLKLLEEECTRAGIRVAPVTFDDHTGILHIPRETVPLLQNEKSKETLLGIAVWQAGIDHHPWTDLVYRHLDSGVPIAVLDESGEVYPPSRFKARSSKITVFSYGYSTGSGERMGNYLVESGHRKVAYISMLHRALWSRNRLDGLRQAYGSAGLDNAVTACMIDKYSFSAEYLEQAGVIKSEINDILARSGPGFSDKKILRRTLSHLQGFVPSQLERSVFAQALQPLLERLLEDTKITAWVAADDYTAIPCLDFLESHGVRVPGDLSIAGFDNSFEGFLRKLTSYDFNTAAYIHAMIRSILYPSTVPSDKNPVLFDGEVIVRGTTRIR